MSDASDEPVRIFLGGKPLDAERDETVIAAIARSDPETAGALRAGNRALSDSRGVVVPLDTVVHGGAIFRVVSGPVPRTQNTSPAAD